MEKLDFNNFRVRGYVPEYVWESYAKLTAFHLDRLGIKGGSLTQLTQAWVDLKELNCHYVDRTKIIKNILRFTWGYAQDALAANAFLTYRSALAGRPEKVTLETEEGTVDVPFKKWGRGLYGSDLSEDSYFMIILLKWDELYSILTSNGLNYSPPQFVGEYVYLTIIDD